MKSMLGMMMAMASVSMSGANGSMFDSPRGNRWDNLPNVPKGSTEPDYDGFDNALGEHIKRFEGKPTFEINGLHLPGLSLKHVGKVLRKLMAEYNIPQFKTQEELASQIKHATGIDITEE